MEPVTILLLIIEFGVGALFLSSRSIGRVLWWPIGVMLMAFGAIDLGFEIGFVWSVPLTAILVIILLMRDR